MGGNEIGFSNELNHGCTSVFISLVEDVPMIMSDIAAAFKKNNIAIVRAQIEALSERGAKHTYFVKGAKKDAKLSDHDIERVREDLESVINSSQMENGASALKLEIAGSIKEDATTPETSEGTESEPTDATRIDKLEDAFCREQELKQQICNEMEGQNERLDALLSFPASSGQGVMTL